MAAVSLSAEDLTPFADIELTKAQAMIEDVLALAARVAPCITSPDFEYHAAAKAILRGVVLRWNDQGNAGLSARTITKGPFAESETYDVRQSRRGAFWPSEIESLQELCRGEETSGAFSVDTVSSTGQAHADICALNFGALYCSCGAVLTNLLYPLYEV